MVILSHSFSVTEGPLSPGTPLDVITQTRLSVGGVAVAIFFLYSGILIAKSCERHKSFKQFFYKRILRIFPELIVCVLASIFIIGLAVTNLPWTEYLLHPQSYLYLLNIVMIPVHTLPGVFVHNPYPLVVNAALWTIAAEFMCYIFCFAVYKLLKFKRSSMRNMSVVLGIVILAYIACGHAWMLSFVRALAEFYLGMMLWVYRDRIILSKRLVLAATVLCVVLILAGQDVLAMLICFPYMALWLGWGTPCVFEHFCEKQDYSYGIFLWGFPLQQLLAHLMPGILWWQNMVISWILAFICAYVTTHILKIVRSAFTQVRTRSV